MEKNIGKIDRSLRIILGIVIIIIGAHFNSVWGVMGVVPLITAQIGVCPVYLPFGISTEKKKA